MPIKVMEMLPTMFLRVPPDSRCQNASNRRNFIEKQRCVGGGGIVLLVPATHILQDYVFIKRTMCFMENMCSNMRSTDSILELIKNNIFCTRRAVSLV